ncbi:TPA: capsid protein [Enterobacter kobei]|nr:capsid protein [Enterobacter kobei]HDC4630186.1 capsid protein [Enterobacter kobei]HDC4671418.1 capsid protein [Enterobacter kobei]
MADNSYQPNQFRPHWGGANSDNDIHLEVYDRDVQTQFIYNSIFRSGLTNFKSVANQSNTWRGDRLGSVSVKGRKSGQSLDNQPVRSEKLIVTVDTVSYIRIPIDYQDDWTAPDFRAELTRNMGTAQAKAFDQAHVIQLQKSADFVPPASLAGAFNSGIKEKVTLTGTVASEEDDASALVHGHKKVIEAFIRRDADLGRLVTLIDPAWFSILLEHKKLMNVEFTGGRGVNDFAMRRVAYVNGIRIIESNAFPQAAITNHILGADFNVTAEEIKRKMIIFDPSLALVTVEAQPLFNRVWDDERELTNVLDSFHMYTVGQRRPDVVGVVTTEA